MIHQPQHYLRTVYPAPDAHARLFLEVLERTNRQGPLGRNVLSYDGCDARIHESVRCGVHYSGLHLLRC
jgi:hypothetical protein